MDIQLLCNEIKNATAYGSSHRLVYIDLQKTVSNF